MRDEYNLRPILRPTQVVRRIHMKIRELAWEIHPRLKDRQRIFVGRNEEMKKIEERYDDYMRPQPTALICSGLHLIGRKKTMQQGLIKSAKIEETYVPSQILMTAQDSVEDFILRVADLGISETNISNLHSISLNEKIELAADLCKSLQEQDEVILIEDTGALINYERKLAPWFSKVLDLLVPNGITCLAIASRFRPNFNEVRRDDVFYFSLAELNINERMGLLKRIAEFEKLILKSEDYDYFKNLLHGYPDQVFYAVSIIKDMGLPTAKKKTELLVEFNFDRAAKLVEDYAPTDSEKGFLYLLSEFDFISFDFLESLVDLKDYTNSLQRFLAGGNMRNLRFER